jgi:nucleolar protein 56
MGADLDEEDVKAIQEFASRIIDLYQLRKNIEKYIDNVLKEIAPNMREIAGPILTAKLIAKAGGLDKLARMPSSTIQLIGAEKALFRHLHGRGNSPRFGYIFMHSLIQNAPERLKGRIARVLSSKLSIAVKMDYYSKEYKADKLKDELKERVKEILSSK